MHSKDLFQRIVGLNSSSTELRECRHCGCSIEGDTEACPECGSQEIATYELR
jgi:anaerobic ribonucleoside-triphosphate reductase